MNKLEKIQSLYETTLRKSIQHHLQENRQKGMPDFVNGVLVMNIGGEMLRSLTSGYDTMPDDMKDEISQQDLYKAISKSTAIVLNEFISPLPPPFCDYI